MPSWQWFLSCHQDLREHLHTLSRQIPPWESRVPGGRWREHRWSSRGCWVFCGVSTSNVPVYSSIDVFGPSPCFFLGRERPASDFQLKELNPFSFFLTSSLSFPFLLWGAQGCPLATSSFWWGLWPRMPPAYLTVLSPLIGTPIPVVWVTGAHLAAVLLLQKVKLPSMFILATSFSSFEGIVSSSFS